jgi:hypothetical protein
MNKKYIIVPSALALVVALGFTTPSELYVVRGCEAVVTKYWEANYSESYITIDFEGRSRVVTDYWSEMVSENKAVTFNGPREGQRTNSYGFVEPNYPSTPIKAHWDNSAFDNFSKHRTSSLTVYAVSQEDDTSFSIHSSEYLSCLAKIDGEVEVKTWFFITYSSDF